MQTTWQSAATLASSASAVSIEWLKSSSDDGRRPHCRLVTRETNTRIRTRNEKGEIDETMARSVRAICGLWKADGFIITRVTSAHACKGVCAVQYTRQGWILRIQLRSWE